MLSGERFGLGFPLVGSGADQDNFGSQFGGGFALDQRSIVGHHDYRFHLERSRRVGDALGVIAAGIGDNAALALGLGEGSDLVISSAKLEGADGLFVLGLEKETARVGAAERKFDQFGVQGDALQAGLRFCDVGKIDHAFSYAYALRVSLIAQFSPV